MVPIEECLGELVVGWQGVALLVWNLMHKMEGIRVNSFWGVEEEVGVGAMLVLGETVVMVEKEVIIRLVMVVEMMVEGEGEGVGLLY